MQSKKEKWISVFSALPLLFSWLVGLIFFSKSEYVRRQSLKSAMLSYLFLFAMLILWVLARLPFLGFYIRFANPFLGGFLALSYILISFAFVVGILKNKPWEISLLETQVKKFI